ncbi:hypothetical protein BDZ91DRAFT_816722 [Kalaharituber pfeilii]|nr:hypothetical protein BDZ91DRAFT_816722 [Kalaharituber pfeilii]
MIANAPISGFLPGCEYPDFQLDDYSSIRNEDINLQLNASYLFGGFVARLLGRKNAQTLSEIAVEMSHYRKDVFTEWCRAYFSDNLQTESLEERRIIELAHARLNYELDSVEHGLCQLFQVFQPITQLSHNAMAGGITAHIADEGEEFDLPKHGANGNVYSNDSSHWDVDPTLLNSSDIYGRNLSEMNTPATTVSSSPPLSFMQPQYSPDLFTFQDDPLCSSPQIAPSRLLTHGSSTSTSHATRNPGICYKATEIWFPEFLDRWLKENLDSSEERLINFINMKQYSIERIFKSLQAIDTTSVDRDKPAANELNHFSSVDFYTAAVEVAYEIDKRIKLGPVKRNKGFSITGISYEDRVELVCKYFIQCKNSCVRLCKPSFLTDVVDMTPKMLERFHTNTQGNEAKANKRKAAAERAGRTKKSTRTAILPFSKLRMADSMSPHRVSKRVSLRKSTGATDDDDSEYDGEYVRVAQSHVDPKMLDSTLHPQPIRFHSYPMAN